MDIKRLAIFFAVSFAILIGWEQIFPSPKPTPAAVAAQQTTAQQPVAAVSPLTPAVPITVTTDTVTAIIDEKSGDLRGLTLLQHDATNDANQKFVLFNDKPENTYIAQAYLVDATGKNLTDGLNYTAAQKEYTLAGDSIEVRLKTKTSDGIEIDKVYTFKKGSYVIDVRFDVVNRSGKSVKPTAVYRMVRDGKDPEGTGRFMYSYTGPVVYTPEGEFQKVSFSDLNDDFTSGRDQAEYERKTQTGWVGMVQHYFAATWILQPLNGNTVCTTETCRIDVKRRNDNLYAAGVDVPQVELPHNMQQSYAISLYAGPQTTSELKKVAQDLELVKDYGRIYWPATGLFWLLEKLHGFTSNWGWAIVLLTIIVKAFLYPLNDAAYRSMAKMRAVAPKLEALKKRYGDDRMGLQQAMMQLYRDEKINPLGGCLPMLLQIPVFIGLYWAIFSSVELRQAPWLGWITDLSRTDPYYILPLLMAATMWFQTKLNPPPTDPTQAQMMKIMPIVFSIMFFFFPAGLVLYYVVNNLLSIAQQWYINRRIERQRKEGEVVS